MAAETEKLEKRSEGLGGEVKVEKSIDLTAGIPKPVKKTFAEQVSTKEMDKRLKGSAITGVNTPAPAGAGVFTPVIALPLRRLSISFVLTCSAKVFFTGFGMPAVRSMLFSTFTSPPRPSLRFSSFSVSAATFHDLFLRPGAVDRAGEGATNRFRLAHVVHIAEGRRGVGIKEKLLGFVLGGLTRLERGVRLLRIFFEETIK